MEQLIGGLFGLMLNAIPPPFMAPPSYQPPPYVYAPQPQGEGRSHPVLHNGSLMTLTVWPDKNLVIVYAQPKPSLLAIGVMPGTLLIRGQWHDERVFSGVSHVYTYCGALPYAVTGRIDGQALAMEGPAPRVWEGTCIVSDYVWTHNSYLRFERVPDDQPIGEKP